MLLLLLGLSNFLHFSCSHLDSCPPMWGMIVTLLSTPSLLSSPPEQTGFDNTDVDARDVGTSVCCFHLRQFCELIFGGSDTVIVILILSNCFRKKCHKELLHVMLIFRISFSFGLDPNILD